MANLIDLLSQLLASGPPSVTTGPNAQDRQPAIAPGARRMPPMGRMPPPMAGNGGQVAPQQAMAAPQMGGGGSPLAGLMQLLMPNLRQDNSAAVRAGYFARNGIDPGLAQVIGSDPVLSRQFIADRMQGQQPAKPIEINGRLVDPTNYKVLADFSDPKKPDDARTTDEKEYERAVAQGFKGTFMDYQVKMKEAGRSQVNIETGEKLPPGYRWTDSDNREAGVEPIPGGPAEQIPGELAARIGLADQFLTDVAPKLRSKLATGDATGIIDRFNAGNNQASPAAGVYRDLELGTEALQRMLTGAGMNIAEAENYARRFLPTYTDNAASATAKLDQLVEALKGAREKAMRGRGGASRPAAPSDGGDPLGIR